MIFDSRKSLRPFLDMAARFRIRGHAAKPFNRSWPCVIRSDRKNRIPPKPRAQMRVIRRAAPGVFCSVQQFGAGELAEPGTSARHDLHQSQGADRRNRARVVPAFGFCQCLDFCRIHASALRCVLINSHRGRCKQQPRNQDFERHLLQASRA